MNKILTILLLSMFMPLASQVNAQGKEPWTFKPVLKRITGVPVAGVAPDQSTEAEIRRNTANNLYIGLFIQNQGNPIPTTGTRSSRITNGIVGAATITLNIDLTPSGGLTSDMLIHYLAPASGDPFTWHSSDAIAGTFNIVSAVAYHRYVVLISAELLMNEKKSAVRCAVEETECEVFLGTLEFDLDSYPDVAGAVALSISNFSPILQASDATNATVVKADITDTDTLIQTVCSTVDGCPSAKN